MNRNLTILYYLHWQEMCHVMRKVNFSTKRLKRHMKASLLEMQKEKEEERFLEICQLQANDSRQYSIDNIYI